MSTNCQFTEMVHVLALLARAQAPNPRCLVGRNIQDVLIEIGIEMDDLISGALSSITIADVMDRVLQRASPA